MFEHYLRAASLGAFLALGVAPAIAEQATWEMAMNDADVRDVVREVGAILDQTIILDPRVQGRITVLSSEQLDREGIRRLFYSVLNAQGFAAVNDGDRLLVLPANEAKAWANQQYEAIPAAFTTQVFNLSGSVAADLAGLLRPLVSSNGYIGPSSSANALVITDSAANLERMRTLIAQLDSCQRHDHELVTLQHAQVSDLLSVLEAAAGSSDSGVRVLADERGNRVLVLGPIKSRLRLAQLARSMDVPAPLNAQNWRVVRLQHSNAEQLAEVLSEVGKRMERKPTPDALDSAALGQAVIKADTSQNALVLLGSPPTLGSVVQIIEQLDQPRAQVLIHAAIVEVSGDISEALGLQWGVNTGSLKGGITVPESGVTLPDLLGSELALPGGAALAAGSDRFAVLVSALASNSRSNLLSTPSLLTLDNQEAQILVGQNVPFKTGSYTTPGSGSDNPFNTVERQDVGISLKVRPYINEGRSLRLEVEQESSEVVPSALEDDLVTNKRSLKSTILAQDGEIIVIGGLIKDSVKSEQRGVPGLSRLPWVGGLFRWTRDVQEKTNLMVFLRPTVLRTPQQLIDTGERAWQDLRAAPAARLPQESRQLFEGQQP